MNDKILHRQHKTALANALRVLWEQAHGTLAGHVRVLAGSDSVAVLIENALGPAEQAMAKRADGQVLLKRYAEQLLGAIQRDLQTQVESITGRRLALSSVHADPASGYVLCFYVLDDGQSQQSESRTENSVPNPGSADDEP